MNTYQNSKFPVFEAEQVLSHKELNSIISFFDEQIRLSRTKLVGVGIVNGLELSFPNNKSVHIECGTAITSIGCVVSFPSNTYTHYFNDTLSDEFLHPNYTNETFLGSYFEKSNAYNIFKNCLTLLPASSTESTKVEISEGFFDDKLILLLLEVHLINQKNCVSTNCDDKGKRIEFTIKPIVINKDLWSSSLFNQQPTIPYLEQLKAPRFNIPHQQITDSNDIFDAFHQLCTNSFSQKLSEAVNTLYQYFKDDLDSTSKDNILENINVQIQTLLSKTNHKSNYQYIYDWIMDIAATYNEIISLPHIQDEWSCKQATPNFPFHVCLGGKQAEAQAYRTSFYPIPQHVNDNQLSRKNLNRLFKRLVLMVRHFAVPNGTIKITPSIIGAYPLSEKAIPFYYPNLTALNNNWKAISSQYFKPQLLGYHFTDNNYNQNENNEGLPLECDLDGYNFFRIEGHIGKDYQEAIDDIELYKNSYHLPFHTTAVNAADFNKKTIQISKFQGRWDDLETDYDLARKRLFNISEFVVNWLNKNKSKFSDNNILLTAQNVIQLQEMIHEMGELLTKDLIAFLDNYEEFAAVFKQMNELFLFHKLCMHLQPQAFTKLAEDMIDRMDDINELFLEDPFEVLYDEAYRRWSLTFKQLSFEHFYDKHPGLEHRSGVTKGGTFVLVYLDNSVFQEKKVIFKPATLLLLSKIDSYKNVFQFNDQQKKEIETSITLKRFKSKIPKKDDTVLNDCEQQTEKIKATLLDNIKIDLGSKFSKPIQQYLTSKLTHIIKLPVNIKPQVATYQNKVIADFYLPYICCSEGNTLAIQIEKKQPIVIAIAKQKFCSNDQEAYEINIVGGGGEGTFIGETAMAITKSENIWLFHPAKLPATQNTFNIQYSLNGNVSNALVISIEVPQTLEWKTKRDPKQPNTCHFLLKDNNEKVTYIFNFGDGSKDEETNGTEMHHEFPFSTKQTSFEITIIQKDSVCYNQQVITIKQADFDVKDFNNNDFLTI